MINYLIIPIIVSFIFTLLVIPFWIKKAKQIGLVWDDMNKIKAEKVAGSGGIIVVGGFSLSILLYIAYTVFFLETKNSHLIETFALLNVILLVAGIAFVDDLMGWRRKGLSRKSRLLFIAFASIPLMVINAGRSNIEFPFIGNIELGIFYPLVLIPIGIIGATSTFNFLAGFNGLEAGQGIILLSSLSIVALFTGNSWLSVIALCLVSSLFAFLFYNFYPAKLFPGDSLTYAVGGMIAMMAILGNFEKIAVFFFIPYILETVLKARGSLIKQSFGKPLEDGSLDAKYDKIYGLGHLSIYLFKKAGIKPTEKKVVYSIWIFQILIIISGFLIFRGGVFV